MRTVHGCLLGCLVSLMLVCGSWTSPAVPLSRSAPSQVETGGDIEDILQQINGTTLLAYDSAIQGFGPHPTGSPAIGQLEQYLVAQLSQTDLLIRQLPWSAHLRHGINIEATLPGGAFASNVLVLCAHYDSVVVSPGADDDGSGTSALLASAIVLSQYRFNCTVRFLLFSGEEQGLLGSGVYAQQARALHEKIIGVVALDGIGHCDLNATVHKMFVKEDPSSAWMLSRSQAIAAAYPDLINLTVLPGENEGDSDHQSFINQGYPGECFREEILDPFYHTSQDTLAYVNISYLTSMCRLAAGTIALLAEMHRVLSSDDLALHLLGSLAVRLTLCTLIVQNQGALQDTANLSIHLAILNRRTGEVMKTPKNFSLEWTLKAEVGSSWVLKIGRQNAPNRRIIISATVTGIGDDEGLYRHIERKGFILHHWFLILT